jgi:sec-independent protein translocase protein TatB
MFGVDFSEIALIFLIALVVLGPAKLPQVAQTIGKWVGRARVMARQFREQLEQEANEIKRATDVRASPPRPAAAATTAAAPTPAPTGTASAPEATAPEAMAPEVPPPASAEHLPITPVEGMSFAHGGVPAEVWPPADPPAPAESAPVPQDHPAPLPAEPHERGA